MKLIEKLAQDLENTGLSNSQATEIIQQFTSNPTPEMAKRYNDDLYKFPTMIYAALWSRCRRLAQEYLSANGIKGMISFNLLRYRPML